VIWTNFLVQVPTNGGPVPPEALRHALHVGLLALYRSGQLGVSVPADRCEVQPVVPASAAPDPDGWDDWSRPAGW
jgi:hypothetical protein